MVQYPSRISRVHTCRPVSHTQMIQIQISTVLFLAATVNAFYRSKENPPPRAYMPEQDLNPQQMVTRHGYRGESHIVRSSDGYFLTLHRIPCSRETSRENCGKGQPVLLRHGIFCSSAEWVLLGPEKGLAYMLADAGYDVWMGNARGNTYSRKHERLPNTDIKFWDFSWHEMGMFDVPAEIDYIYDVKARETNETRNDLIYVGHSMGTTMFFVMMSTRPEYSKRVKAMFALAPVGYMGHIRSPIRILGPFSRDIEFMSQLLGEGRMLPQSWFWRVLTTISCKRAMSENGVCENIVFILNGFNADQYNRTLEPVLLSHTPAGASTKSYVHYCQLANAKQPLQYFDYGRSINEVLYKSPTPPFYGYKNIKMPVYLMYGDNDWVADPTDVKLLHQDLKEAGVEVDLYRVQDDKFNHVDFTWGIDAKEKVYDRVLNLMENYRVNYGS